jgi:nitrogen fixation NifU-like protein
MKEELYQQAILTQAEAAVRAGRLDTPDGSVTLDNPLCGDRVSIDVKLAGGRIVDLAHRVRGCRLCEAAASAIGANAVGLGLETVAAAEASMRALLEGRSGPVDVWHDLEAFRPVRDYKSRHACVLLPFETLRAAIAEAQAGADRRKGG